MNSFREILDAWPSVIELAKDLGEKPNTMHKWRSRNRIPSDCWETLLRAANKRKIKVTAALLIRLASKAT